MSSEILSVLEYMEKEKGIPRADMISTITNALKTAAQKGVNSGQELKIDINRTMAQQSGLAEKDVANDVLVSLSSSGQVAPSYWIDPRGVSTLCAAWRRTLL